MEHENILDTAYSDNENQPTPELAIEAALKQALGQLQKWDLSHQEINYLVINTCASLEEQRWRLSINESIEEKLLHIFTTERTIRILAVLLTFLFTMIYFKYERHITIKRPDGKERER